MPIRWPKLQVRARGLSGRIVVGRRLGRLSQRPNGQRQQAGDAAPTYGPSLLLDYEVEFGVWIGPGNSLGEPIPIAEAGPSISGASACSMTSRPAIFSAGKRSLSGPFLGKNFGTVVSPWVVTPEALAPFRVPQPSRPDGDPRPLEYLWDDADQATVLSTSSSKRPPDEAHEGGGLARTSLSRANTTDLYWTAAQFIAHHTSGGCNLRPGDLFGSGTISGPRG